MSPSETPTIELLAQATNSEVSPPFANAKAITELQRRGTREVFDAAQRLVHSEVSHERRVGFDILAQLGFTERSFWNETLPLINECLRSERDRDVIEAALIAFSHNEFGPDSLPLVLAFAEHSDADLRHAVVMAIGASHSQEAINPLITLSNDSAAHVRDWATFYLGSINTADSPEIRAALVARLEDSDFDTRSEAIIGLAARHDSRVVPALLNELSSENVGSLAIEAAELIRSAELLPALEALCAWWDIDSDLLSRAIAACQNQPDDRSHQ